MPNDDLYAALAGTPDDLEDDLNVEVRRVRFKQAVRVKGMEDEQRRRAADLASNG